ncbi:helix-turn-helix domain-containing protein [Actinocrispum sp. NPDC049592]|uniref:winged helix-turn-helix transcriptional regulator n=1 Tax=Actinocrispum sp. NPDC049592 TaxID=3154835 RepID=UPI00343B5A08
MSVQRTQYHCPVELAVDVIGGKWAVVILAHLKEGDLRYGELRRKVPDITEKMLTQRLRELTEAGLIERTEHETAPPGVSYKLVADDLRPVLQALYDWGQNRAASKGIEIVTP